MIQAFFKACWEWLRDKAWPKVSDSYVDHELVRHAVTVIVAAFVIKVFW